MGNQLNLNPSPSSPKSFSFSDNQKDEDNIGIKSILKGENSEDSLHLPPSPSTLKSFLDCLSISPPKSIYDQGKTLGKEMFFNPKDEDNTRIESILKGEKPEDEKESRAIAVFLYSALGDALGTHTEFDEYKRAGMKEIKDFECIKEVQKELRAPLGAWTDDTSMALCLADSLIMNNFQLDNLDLRRRFLAWWHQGYNNGMNGEQYSFGLGGNIKNSFDEFYKKQTPVVLEGKRDNNGNGSLMRLAPVPIAFHKNEEEGMNVAAEQSFSTHNGEEASECCRLLAHLIIRLINRENFEFQNIFESLGSSFSSINQAVQCLANSTMEPTLLPEYSEKVNLTVKDRNWNWKDKEFDFSETRRILYPSYIGSYCMDALSMALHLSYHSKDPKTPILNAVNQGGDSDTVAAITGIIVGAIYGLDEEMLVLCKGIKEEFMLAMRAYKLFHRKGFCFD